MERPIALREWAVAVRALEEGRQAIVLRKGGIAEETKEFRLESPEFYLFPSYEHQRPELVKPEFRDAVEATRAEAAANPGRVRLTSYAEAAEDYEVTDAKTLERLNELHIWTADYAEERLKWKKTKPLHVLLLRVFKFDEPIEIPESDSYGGCKSWLRLEEEIAQRTRKPVLDDRQFANQAELLSRAVRG
ncbi:MULTISPECIES: DUF1802 family protein [Cohnella]|uniref:DUF1802 family protein n=1 Tax=Cohnella TaxID=329857 RepID=UPI0009BB2767|nr:MULTISPECIES: DUF1802 family protein [Cohnella]MBN2984953.1 DUF1802 family protein [Cohnella algarum]